MHKNIGISNLYARQLQEIGYAPEHAEILSELLIISAGPLSKMFGRELEEYLLEKFAGYHQIESLKLNLKENEIIRSDIPRKSNLDTMNIISLDTDFIPKGGIKELTKWIKEILLEHGNWIYIKSSGRFIEFPKKGITSSIRKYDIDARNEIAHRQSYFMLRKMVEMAEYWKSRLPAGKHLEDGMQDIYTSALNLNGSLYAVEIRLNEPSEHTKEMSHIYGSKIPDNYYKEHRLDEIEIEIAPAHNGTEAIDNDGSARPEQDISRSTGAISKISLGILRSCVKASMIIKNALYNKENGKKPQGDMRALFDGRRMIALFANHNASTILHETAHFWLEELREAQSFSSFPDWAKELWHNLENAYGFDEKTVKPARWAEVQERFAKEFEVYCKNGKAPVKVLRPAFNKFKEWLAGICDYMTNTILNDKIRSVSKQVFDTILGNKEEELERPAYRPMRM